jgi:acetyltransferase-like isoleucine patch superfamily enzyme
MISQKASLYGDVRVHPSSRIDDFAVLSGTIIIGRCVHIACHCSLIGEIELGDFSGLSGGVRIYSRSDDYSGEWMTNPCVPSHLTRVDARPVRIGRHAIVGANAVILPGVTVGEGAAIGSGAMITRDVPSWAVAVGRNKVIGERSRRVLDLERSCAF